MRALPDKHTMTTFFKVCLLLVWHAPLIHSTAVPLAVGDDFVMKDGILMQVNSVKSLNMTWHSNIADYKLDVLNNDMILGASFDSCIEQEKEDNTKKGTTIEFKDIAKNAGIHHQHRDHIAARPHCAFDFIVPFHNSSRRATLSGEFCTLDYMTGGVAAGDYDGDGLQDLFFTVFHKRSTLYKNLGNGKFLDVTVETGVGPDKFGNGALWVDIDQDGDLDLYVTTVGDSRHYLYINYGGVFREEASKRGLSLEFANKRKLSGFTPSFGDFDSDGYPDIYVSEWILHTLDGYPSASKLLRNLGKAKPGFFEDVTDKAGVNMDYFWRTRTKLNAGTHTFGSSFTDFDNDGHQELLITGDYGESKMFWNNGNMTFSECTKPCGLIGDIDAMGHAIGDLNNDGYMEWFSSAIFDNITNCEISGCMFGNKGNKLYRNLGNRSFTEIADKAGVRVGGWAWGAAFIDFNNDGFLDIVLTNGFDTASTTIDDGFMKQQMILYQNYGDEMGSELEGKMKEISSEHGMNFDGMGRGLLKLDYDNDGDEDVVIATNYGRAVFYENVGGNAKNWLRIRAVHRCLENSAKLCDSFGARVTVTDAKGKNQTQEIGSSTHFLGQSEITAHFGLGNCKQNLTVIVVWPTTRQTVIINGVKSRKTLRIVKPRNTRHEVSDFSKIYKCQGLSITDVSLEPGAPFGVEISRDRKSLSLKLHPAIPLNGLGKQRFTYTVKIDSSPSKRCKGVVNIDARVYVRNKTVTSVCPHGRMWFPGMPIPVGTTKRAYNGISNNRKNTYWGAGFENLRRLVPSKYQDDISMPAATCSKHQMTTNSCPFPHENSGYGSNRPSARFISNELFAQKAPVISERGLSDLHVHYGQFFVHDLDFSSPLPRFEFQHNLNEVWMQISVPKNDTHFDQDGTGNTYLPFTRSIYNRCTGQYPNGYSREQVNKISSYIDGNHIYGYSESRCKKLRSMKDGKMKLDEDGMIPRNVFGLDNDNSIGRVPSKLRVAGDTRANVAPGLLAFHTLFVMEHNRLCEEYKSRHPKATDEEIFQYARRIIIAEQQAIAFREYLPALVGMASVPPYKGYNASLDASISSVFATAAFRFGHSQVNTHIFRLDENWDTYKHGHILLRESYFHPERIEHEGGIEPVLRGMIYMPAQKIDTLMVDDLRNALFPVGRFNGLDLAAMNIQRGRDHGLPDFNSVRKFLGLKAYKKFSEISSDSDVTRKLQELYKDINNIDLWVGGLAEDHLHDSELGETFHTIFLEGILRVRDGDRFWYERTMSKEEIDMVNELTLSKIIKLNTGIDDIPGNVFFSTKICRDIANHKCMRHQRNGPNMAVEHPNTIKYKKAMFAKRFGMRKEPSKKLGRKYSIVNVVAIVFGVIILLSIIALGVFLFRRRSNRKMAKTSELDENCAAETNGHVSDNGHEETIFMLNGKSSQNGQVAKKPPSI